MIADKATIENGEFMSWAFKLIDNNEEVASFSGSFSDMTEALATALSEHVLDSNGHVKKSKPPEAEQVTSADRDNAIIEAITKSVSASLQQKLAEANR